MRIQWWDNYRTLMDTGYGFQYLVRNYVQLVSRIIHKHASKNKELLRKKQ